MGKVSLGFETGGREKARATFPILRYRACAVVLWAALFGGAIAGLWNGLFCGRAWGVQDDGELLFLRPDGSTAVSITIEVADTPEARIAGLKERWFLPDHHGMLFIFDSPEIQRFWMHRTPLSLDMIFVDENRGILNIVESTIPLSEETYGSDGPAKYVVEVRAGFSKRHGIQKGMTIQWRTRAKPRP